MAVQTTRDSRYDYYNTGELFPNWSWYFRTFPGEKSATISAWSAHSAFSYNQLNAGHAENPLDDFVGTSTLACIHYRLGDLKPTQQIVINSAMAQSPQAFKVGTLLTPDFHAKINWPHVDSPLTEPGGRGHLLKGVVTGLAKNSFDDIQITLLHEIGLTRYLVPNKMRLQFVTGTSDSDPGAGDDPGVFLFSFPF